MCNFPNVRIEFCTNILYANINRNTLHSTKHYLHNYKALIFPFIFDKVSKTRKKPLWQIATKHACIVQYKYLSLCCIAIERYFNFIVTNEK